MDLSNVPVGFGMALAQNEAAMGRYAESDEIQKHDALTRARNARSETKTHTLVAEPGSGKVFQK